MQKKCFKCGLMKPLSDFYKHSQMADGHLNKCKECNKKDVRLNYQANHDYYVAYERNRAQSPDRRSQWYGQTKRMRKAHPEQFKARGRVNNAIRDGRLERKPCEVCGTTEKVQAHHKDYSKPLDVQWLCFKHHREVAHGQRCGSDI